MSYSKKRPLPMCLSPGPLPSPRQFDGPHNRQSQHKRSQSQFSLLLQLLYRYNNLGVYRDYVFPSNGQNCCDVREWLLKFVYW